MATKKQMKLVDGHTGKMECKTCGSVHYASLRRGGGYHYGSWQCSSESCPKKREGIIAAGRLAIAAAFDADEGEDGGAYHLDSVEVLFPGMSRAVVHQIGNALYREGNVYVSIQAESDSKMSRLYLSFERGDDWSSAGGNRNTRMAAAACQKLKESGLDASVRTCPIYEPYGTVRADGQMLSVNPPKSPAQSGI
jgi:hypothetical protein